MSEIMARDIIKVRKVGGTLVVTLTQAVLAKVQLEEGDRVMIEAVPPKRIIISREEEPMSNTQRTELELEVLKGRKAALDSQLEFVVAQNNLNMPLQEGLDDSSIVELTIRQITHDRDKVTVELAQKRLEFFDLQGQ